MKTRMSLGVLMTLALLSSFIAVAHAGGGAGSSIDATFFDCYEIRHGDNSPFVLDLTDRFGDQRVRLGKARLLCTPTSAATVVRGPVLNGDFAAVSPGDHLKCYEVAGRQPKAPRVGITIIDPLSNETVTLNELATVCAPAGTNPPLPQ